jgi:hypothetical protein
MLSLGEQIISVVTNVVNMLELELENPMLASLSHVNGNKLGEAMSDGKKKN